MKNQLNTQETDITNIRNVSIDNTQQITQIQNELNNEVPTI